MVNFAANSKGLRWPPLLLPFDTHTLALSVHGPGHTISCVPNSNFPESAKLLLPRVTNCLLLTLSGNDCSKLHLIRFLLLSHTQLY